jgi:hypothetical protein
MTEFLFKDVYFGRGPSCYLQPGNKEYRRVIKLHAAYFHRDAPKAQKSKFIENLRTKLVMQGFRFFRYSESQQNWVDAYQLEVKEKIGHDLRDNRKSFSEGKNQFRFSKTKMRTENKRNHATTDCKGNKKQSEYHGIVEEYHGFQAGFATSCNREPTQLHKMQNHTNYVMIQAFEMQEFYDFSLNERTTKSSDEAALEIKEVKPLMSSTGEKYVSRSMKKTLTPEPNVKCRTIDGASLCKRLSDSVLYPFINDTDEGEEN